MRIAVLGIGGVGGYYGGKLARHYDSGGDVEVAFIARGEHLEQIRKRGLKLLTPEGNLTATPAIATDNPNEIGLVDLMIICVKTYDLESWMRILEKNVGEMLKTIKTKKDGTIEKNTNIKGNVIIGKNTVVMSGTYIEGPVVIGENCKVGPNCYIRPFTSIGNNCHVGNASEVKNSIIMDNSNTPHQNYIGDSIIGMNCNLGSGCKVANLRLNKKDIIVVLNGKQIDSKRRKLGVIMGDDVQTGINSMMNVGCMLGNNVFIGPGAIAQGEIKPNSKIM